MTKAISYALALFIIALPVTAQTPPTVDITATNNNGDRDSTWPGLQVNEGDTVTISITPSTTVTSGAVFYDSAVSGSLTPGDTNNILGNPLSSFISSLSSGSGFRGGGGSANGLTFLIRIRNDGLAEEDETLTITISNLQAIAGNTQGFMLGTDSVTFTVRGADTAPAFGTVADKTFFQGVSITEFQLPISGGNGPISYAVSNLPAGLTLDNDGSGSCTSTEPGTICGTPTNTGAQRVTVTATDADSNTASSDTATLTFTMTVNPRPATVDISATNNNGDRDSTWPGLQVNEGDTVTISITPSTTVTSGAVFYDSAVSGSLTPGDTNNILGNPLSSFISSLSSGSGFRGGGGSANGLTFLIRIRNDGLAEEDETLTITISNLQAIAGNTQGFMLGTDSVTFTVRGADTAPAFGTVADKTFFQGVSITEFQLPISGGNGPISYAVSNLPAGLTLDNDGSGSCTSTEPGTICGTPTNTGAQRVTVTATDADSNTANTDTATLTFTITVVLHPIDLNNSGTLDANDAFVLFRHYSGVPVTAAEAMGADNWSEELGRPQGGDLNSDRSINQSDALIMFYVYEFGDLLNQSAVLRQLLLNGVRGRMPPTDATYRELLRRANRLR